MGSGQRLRSARSPRESLATIEALVDGFRPRKYPHLPAYDLTGAAWAGAGAAPDLTVSFDDAVGDFILVALWPIPEGTELGLFPLGSGDDRLATLGVIASWQQRDPSLCSAGLISGGQITLRPPRVGHDFVSESLRLGGIADTPRNTAVVGGKLAEMLLLKALQFIAGTDQRAADRFAEAHRYSGGAIEDHLQRILDDLAAWNVGVLPYIQGAATRCRAVLLDAHAQSPGLLPLD